MLLLQWAMWVLNNEELTQQRDAAWCISCQIEQQHCKSHHHGHAGLLKPWSLELDASSACEESALVSNKTFVCSHRKG